MTDSHPCASRSNARKSLMLTTTNHAQEEPLRGVLGGMSLFLAKGAP